MYCLTINPIDEYTFDSLGLISKTSTSKITTKILQNKSSTHKNFKLWIPLKRVKQFFHNIKKWDLYWFREITAEELRANIRTTKTEIARRCPLANALSSMASILILDSGDVYTVGKHRIGINWDKGHVSFNTLAYQSIRQYYIAQYIHSETLINMLHDKGCFSKQNRIKGREGYAVKTTFKKKFRTIDWSNILAISFSYLELQYTLKYRSISKNFNKAIKNNWKLLLNVDEDSKMRLDVKRLNPKFKEIFNEAK